VERLIGSIRRECLDHVVVLNERYLRRLRRLLSAYVDYYHRSRTHLALTKDAPEPRAAAAAQTGVSSRWPGSAVCIIATNAARPERRRART